MSFSNWLRNLRCVLTPGQMERKHRRQRPHRAATHRPQLEALEDRCLLSFSPVVNYAVGDNPQAVVTGHFNNDTVLDLAVANYNSSTVSVLLGNPGGTFQDAVNYDTGYGPLSVAVGDLDGDLDIDIATANAGDVSVLFGNGDGTFQAPSNTYIGSQPASVAVGDFNDDGMLDLGVTSNVYYPPYWGGYGSYPGFHTGRANVLMGTGAGSFAAPVAVYLGYGYHTSATVADFNGDGKDDFATVNTDYGNVSVLLGTTAGLVASTNFNTGFYPHAVTVGEFTGDDILDLATAGQTVDILPGNGDGTFVQVVRQYVDPIALAPADFNGDGKLDLVTADFSDTVGVLLGTGDGAFRPPIGVATGGWAAEVAVGDFNGDGRPDVASANPSSDNISVLLNDGTWLALGAPLITINDVTITEGNTGTVSAEFTVSLSAAYSQIVSVDYATANGDATVAGGDYQADLGTLTFNPGEPLTQTIPVLVNGDRLIEHIFEYFFVALSNPTNAFLADTSGFGAITDDEPHVSIDHGPVYVTEGNSGTVNAEFTVRLSNIYDEPVSVNYSTVEGDTEWWYWGWYYEPPPATSDSDFQSAVSKTLTFDPGETIKTIPIVVYGDRLGESDEYFSVNLIDASGATLDAAHAVGVILNDEPIASISGGGTVTEGNTGTAALTFTVTLSAPSVDIVTVAYATADGTAAGGDYQAKTDTLTFGIGETSQSFTVLVNGDRLAEYDEYFYVNLTGATGAAIDSYGYATAYATIVDNEPRLSINSVSVTEGHRGTKVMTFTVTLSAAYDQAVTVNFATSNSGATAGEDYVATSGTLTFAPGQTTKTFTVTIKGDKKKEANESFYVILSGASSNALIENAYGWGTILNDDGPNR